MPAYVILDVDVHDRELYAEYGRQTAPTVAAHGGRYVVRGGEFDVVEGEWDLHRVVVLEFPDVGAARAWHDGPEYAPLKEMRERAATSRAIVIEGYDA